VGYHTEASLTTNGVRAQNKDGIKKESFKSLKYQDTLWMMFTNLNLSEYPAKPHTAFLKILSKISLGKSRRFKITEFIIYWKFPVNLGKTIKISLYFFTGSSPSMAFRIAEFFGTKDSSSTIFWRVNLGKNKPNALINSEWGIMDILKILPFGAVELCED
jgi:hypothetical protein